MNKSMLKLNGSFSDMLEKLGQNAKNPCLFDGEGWDKTLAWNPCDTYILNTDNKPGEELERFIGYHRSKQHLIAGYISYDTGLQLMDVRSKKTHDKGCPYIVFHAYANYLTSSAKGTWAYYEESSFLSEIKKMDGIKAGKKDMALPNFKPSQDKKIFEKAFKKIKEYIYEGYIYQLNLAHELKGSSEQNPRELYAKLSSLNNSKMKAYLECKGFELLSMSPERFVRTRGKNIETEPIKGTRPRGRTKAEDSANERSLLSDEKEKAELNMITDLLRNDLGKVCRAGSVKVLKDKQLDKLTSVMHTSSLINGVLKENIAPINALLSMFPGGSITGCPKKKAIEIIDELEEIARGPYCGCMVMIDKDGNLDSSILIRTVIKKGKGLSLSVGSGIVNDSKMENEYRETIYKAQSLAKNLIAKN